MPPATYKGSVMECPDCGGWDFTYDFPSITDPEGGTFYMKVTCVGCGESNWLGYLVPTAPVPMMKYAKVSPAEGPDDDPSTDS